LVINLKCFKFAKEDNQFRAVLTHGSFSKKI